MAEDTIRFDIEGAATPGEAQPPRDIPEWQRWNDYGIGALLAPQRRQLRQAEEAFTKVEALGQSVGALNLARVYLEEGRLDEAAAALERARQHPEPPYPWSMAWFTGQLLKQEGEFEAALERFRALVDTEFQDARDRGFDFSRDYRLLDELGLTWMEIAKLYQASGQEDRHVAALGEARSWFERALEGDPERASTHYNLAQLLVQLGEAQAAARHAALHEKYRVDENARDRAIAAARARYPAARAAADPVTIYDLQREGDDARHAARVTPTLLPPRAAP